MFRSRHARRRRRRIDDRHLVPKILPQCFRADRKNASSPESVGRTEAGVAISHCNIINLLSSGRALFLGTTFFASRSPGARSPRRRPRSLIAHQRKTTERSRVKAGGGSGAAEPARGALTLASTVAPSQGDGRPISPTDFSEDPKSTPACSKSAGAGMRPQSALTRSQASSPETRTPT